MIKKLNGLYFPKYRSAYNANTRNGLIGAFFVSFILYCIAAIYLFCYLSIKRRVTFNRKLLQTFDQTNQDKLKDEPAKQQLESRNSNNSNYHPIPLKCLTTHVWIGVWIYCPLAIFISGHVFIQFKFGVTSPVLSGLIIIVTNSNGWVNALGYFYNERIKRSRLRI